VRRILLVGNTTKTPGTMGQRQDKKLNAKGQTQTEFQNRAWGACLRSLIGVLASFSVSP